MTRQRPCKTVLLGNNRILEADHVLEFMLIEQLAAAVDRKTGAVFVAPAAHRVVVFQSKSQRIDLLVARSTFLFRRMLLERFTKSQAFLFKFLVVVFDFRNIGGRRLRWIVKDRRRQRERDKVQRDRKSLPQQELARLIQTLEEEMHEASAELKFEYAARLRDEMNDLRRELRDAQ